MKRLLTHGWIEVQKAEPKARPQTIQDSDTPSLRITIGRFKKTWYCVYYPPGEKQRWEKLGLFPTLSLKDARIEARSRQDTVREGDDPLAEPTSEEMFHGFLDRFVDYAGPTYSAAYFKHTERVIKRLKLHIQDKPIDEVTKREMAACWNQYEGHAKNRIYTVLRSAFNYAIGVEFLIENHPMSGMLKPQAENPRKRFLDKDEIKMVWEAAGEMSGPYGRFVQFYIAMAGCGRKTDIAALRRSDVVSYPVNGVGVDCIEIKHPTKSDRPHIMPLTAQAKGLLEGDDWFFTTTNEGPIKGWTQYKKKLDGMYQLENWTIHDIRRTASTHFGDYLELPPYIIEQIANRKSGDLRGAAGIYNRARYLKQKHEAMLAWEKYLKKILA